MSIRSRVNARQCYPRRGHRCDWSKADYRSALRCSVGANGAGMQRYQTATRIRDTSTARTTSDPQQVPPSCSSSSKQSSNSRADPAVGTALSLCWAISSRSPSRLRIAAMIASLA
jgi:hypothetical protein